MPSRASFVLSTMFHLFSVNYVQNEPLHYSAASWHQSQVVNEKEDMADRRFLWMLLSDLILFYLSVEQLTS